MISFETALDPVDWTEILVNGYYLAFDIVEAKPVEVYFTETAATPSTSVKGNVVSSWPASFDFEVTGMNGGIQRIWARGACSIKGLRE